MLWYWGLLLLCLSATAEKLVVHRRSGENLTLECSTKCLDSFDGLKGMYLYRDDEKVIYYDYEPNLDGKFTHEKRQDLTRILKTGSFQKHNIIISNVTVNDSGFYRCTYKYKENACPKTYIDCNIYKVVISELPPSLPTCSPHESASSLHESCHPSVLIIVLIATMSSLITMLLTIIILKVKEWLNNRRELGNGTLSNEYVYEVMTRNGFGPVSEPPAR